MELEIQSIPECNWGRSLANLLPTEVWDRLRRDVYADANWVCTKCFRTGLELHCHEHWIYNDKKYIQILSELWCICEDCHNLIHWGRTVAEALKGSYSGSHMEQLRKHFCKVNKCTKTEFEGHKTEALMISIKHNKHKWKIDWGIYNPVRIEKLYNTVGRK